MHMNVCIASYIDGGDMTEELLEMAEAFRNKAANPATWLPKDTAKHEGRELEAAALICEEIARCPMSITEQHKLPRKMRKHFVVAWIKVCHKLSNHATSAEITASA